MILAFIIYINKGWNDLQLGGASCCGFKTGVRLETSQYKICDITLAQLVVHIRVLKPTASQDISTGTAFHLSNALDNYSLHVPVLACNNISILDHRLEVLKNRASKAFGKDV